MKYVSKIVIVARFQGTKTLVPKVIGDDGL